MDAKLDAVEARTDTKFTTLIGRLDKIEAATSGIKATVVATGLTVIGITIAVTALGGQMFGLGLDASNVAASVVKKSEARFGTKAGSLNATLESVRAQVEALRLATEAAAHLRTEEESDWRRRWLPPSPLSQTDPSGGRLQQR